MGYNPEKTNANTSGEKPPNSQPDRSKAAQAAGKLAVKGSQK